MSSPRLNKHRPRRERLQNQLFDLPADAHPQDFAVTGRGFAWRVTFRGAPITRDYRYFHKAQEACDTLSRRAGITDRPCITCGGMFESEGVHNRMCDKCRREMSEVA